MSLMAEGHGLCEHQYSLGSELPFAATCLNAGYGPESGLDRKGGVQTFAAIYTKVCYAGHSELLSADCGGQDRLMPIALPNRGLG